MLDSLNVSIDKNDLVITFNSSESVLIDISSSERDSYVLESSGLRYTLKINIFHFNIDDDHVVINGEMIPLEKYRLEKSKFYDDFYMTEKLINAASRKFSPDELFFVCYSYLKKVPKDSPYLGALITLLSYRVIDDLETRSFIYTDLLQAKKEYDDYFNKDNPHSIRWFFSSSSNFIMLSINLDKIEEAEKVSNRLKINSYLIELNPLSYWNYSQGLTLAGLLSVYNDKNEEAGNIFLKNYIFTRNALIDIYHPRNDWLLGQLSDCTALLEIGKLNLLAGTRIYNNNIPSSSRFSNFNATGKEINFRPLFIRFNRLNFNEIDFFNKVYMKLN